MNKKSLEQFIQKMYDLSFSQKNRSYTEAELKELALETGMTESDWEESRRKFQSHTQSGMRHNKHGNYKNAINELEQAESLNPFDADVLLYLAEAYKQKASAENNASDFDKAEFYAQSAIAAGSNSDAAYRIVSSISDKRAVTEQKRKKLFTASLIVVGSILAFLLLGYISAKNTVVSKEEKIKEKWAQVENVYQRRADLIPALVSTVKAAANLEKELLNELTAARAQVGSLYVRPENFTQEEIDDFAAKQQELEKSLLRLLAVSESYPELKSLSNYRDLQAQIEGAENRISVERRRYNEEVQAYNSYIKKFPQSLLGYKEIGYFKAKQSAFEVPEIDL